MAQIESSLRNRASPAANGPVAGFTMIEVLVILLLLAMMSVMSLTFLNQLSGFHGRNADVPYQEEAENAVRHIERTLERALPLPLDVSDLQSRTYFVGGPQVMSFVTQARVGLTEAAVRTTRIGLDADENDDVMVQSIMLRRPEPGRRTDVSEDFEILDGVSELRFGYLLFDDTGSPVWQTAWRKEGLLPLAVSVDLAIERQGRRFEAAGLVKLTASRSVDYYFNCADRGAAVELDRLAELSNCRLRLARSGRVPDYCSC
jgi:hypothetical protein